VCGQPLAGGDPTPTHANHRYLAAPPGVGDHRIFSVDSANRAHRIPMM
jgi:hypothetical protein